MRYVLICVSVTAVLLTVISASAQLVVEHPQYAIVGQFGLPAGLTESLGDMMFSSDGSTVYFIDQSESSVSAVWTAPVMRDGGGNVTGFGAMTQLFAEPDMDTGLEFAPGSSTLFFRGYDPDEPAIGQRQSGGTIEYKRINNYDGTYGGLAFFPSNYSNAGDLVSTSYDDAIIYMHAVSDDGDGTFTVADGTLYADFSGLGLTQGMGDLEFVRSGPLAGTLLIAFYDHTDESLSYIDLNATTGLPAGGTTPTPVPFLSGTTEAWGIAIDPSTGNIWLTIWSPDFEPYLVEIAAQVASPIPAVGPYGIIVLIALLAGAGVAAMRRTM